jgi:hypothetical protein
MMVYKRIKTNSMKKEFVTYDQALALKELGFNEPYSLGYHSLNPTDIRGNNVRLWSEFNKIDVVSCKAITWHTAFRWFREKHEIDSHIEKYLSSEDTIEYFFMANDEESINFETYEEAESACIDKLIEIIKNK